MNNSIIILFYFAIVVIAIMLQNLTSTITESKWEIDTWIGNTEARLMEDILINKKLLKEIEEKVDKIIEEKKVDIKAGDEIIDENNDFYFVTYVYGDKVDGISKEGIVREGMEIGKVKKTGKKGVVCIKQEMPNWV
jgi:hypothetical protein